MVFLFNSRSFKCLSICRTLLSPSVSLTDISFLSIHSLFLVNKFVVQDSKAIGEYINIDVDMNMDFTVEFYETWGYEKNKF